jgi:branched-chain amino acid aminotransferase
MANIQKHMAFEGKIVPTAEATISVASSAVLYGLSIYSVIYGKYTEDGMLLFRVADHLKRMQQSANMIGFDTTDELTDATRVTQTLSELIAINQPTCDQFFRLTIHATDLVPGIKTRNLTLSLSIFMYDAQNILPQDSARIKTSLWRRTADTAIPARAKVNGAYVNSALAKQDALDSGFDDCLFLNQNGYVSELSAANIFMIKNITLITPDTSSDILEGITRRSIIELANTRGLTVIERKVALTELYTADEVLACGTSAFISPITEIDNRIIGTGKIGVLTQSLRDELAVEQGNKKHAWIIVL